MQKEHILLEIVNFLIIVVLDLFRISSSKIAKPGYILIHYFSGSFKV